MEDKQIVEQDSSDGMSETETTLNEEHNDTEKATLGEDLDMVVPNPADDDWYMKGSIYTDDKENRHILKFRMVIMQGSMQNIEAESAGSGNENSETNIDRIIAGLYEKLNIM